MNLLPGVSNSAAAPERYMWLTTDRVLYCGLLGAPTVRTMGTVNLYVATSGQIEIRIGSGPWRYAEVAVTQPYVAHQIRSQARDILVIQIEAETVDLAQLPGFLQCCGAVDAPGVAKDVRSAQQVIRRMAAGAGLDDERFDELIFGERLVERHLEPRIKRVVERIKCDSSVMVGAEECAQLVHLSFSRFLHLFRQEVGAPFRGFRTWKRARSLLHYVNQVANLSHVALDTGYPDSTHFSHSIRQVYGLRPRDIFAGSRKLAIFGTGAKSV